MFTLKKELMVFLGAFVCCFLWGSAFPGIKLGYELWDISGSDTFGIIRFAGVRFFIAGLLVILFAWILRRRPPLPKRNEQGKILLLSLFQTVGQYLFFYIGLAHTTGVNSSVADSLTSFFAILTAALVMRMEPLTARKLLGCMLGFAGVVLINITPEGFTFSPLGDGLIVLSAMCYGVSSSLIKRYSADHDTVIFSGWQFVYGGLIMTAVGQAGIVITGSSGGGSATLPAAAMLLYLALVSSTAYTLWGILLRSSDVSKLSVYGFMTPVTGVVLSALLLGETDRLGLKYALALLLVGAGMVVVNTRSGAAVRKR